MLQKLGNWKKKLMSTNLSILQNQFKSGNYINKISNYFFLYVSIWNKKSLASWETVFLLKIQLHLIFPHVS